MNIVLFVCLTASVNVALVTSKSVPIMQFKIDINVDEQLSSENSGNIVKRSLDNLGYGNILKRAFGPGSLDPLGNGNILKWSKKSSDTRDYKRSLDNLGNGNLLKKRAFGPGPLDPLGNGNIPKWSKKNAYTRDYKRSLDAAVPFVQFYRIAY